MIFDIISSFLKKTDPELAHSLAIKILKNNFLPINKFVKKPEKNISSTNFGIKFTSPIGLAAGFDKNGEVYNDFFNLGFGSVEIGTITPKPQFGNSKPRVFRLSEDRAIINRLGFPNDGVEIIKNRLINNKPQGILGINVGPNKENSEKIEDYINLLNEFKEIANYITINISSPNTEGLRNFHNIEKLKKLLLEINNANKINKIPILIKISPDLKEEAIEDFCQVLVEQRVDGIILTNTTNTNRGNLININKTEKGGLSGFPLFKLSNEKIKTFYKFIAGKLPIIGVGGIFDGETAYEKIKCGASLLQLYTPLVFEGPFIASKINQELSYYLKKDGFENISDAVGIYNK